jgi:hypothetical protein
MPSRIPTSERRSKVRTTKEQNATTLIQAILTDPSRAANDLRADLTDGGDPEVILALLSAAETLSSLRGVDIGTQVAKVKKQLSKEGLLKSHD